MKNKRLNRWIQGVVEFFVRWRTMLSLMTMSWEEIAKDFKPSFIFVVNPGSNRDMSAYMPSGIAWIVRKLCLKWIFPVGMVGKKGMILGFAANATMLKADPELSLQIYEAVREVANRLKVKYIAIAGRVPGIWVSQKFDMSLPFVTGEFGTVYTVVGGVQQAQKKHDIEDINTPIAILGGAGFIGGACVRRLRELKFANITVVDVSIPLVPKQQVGVRYVSHGAALTEAKIVIVLTPKGEDIDAYIQYAAPSSIWLGDTHPKIPEGLIYALEEKGCIVYELGVGKEGVRSWPPMPQWPAELLAGCSAQALTLAVAEASNAIIESQAAFDDVAKCIELVPVLQKRCDGNC